MSFKVAFVIAGTQKAGTTALDFYCRKHPSLIMAKDKEVHFFDNDYLFSKQIDYKYYHNHFKSKVFKNKYLYGEATPIYMYWDSVPERICQYNKNMKWIIILRNPIDRAWSQWNMEHNRGYEKRSFHDSICSNLSETKQHRIFSYVSRGFYSEQLLRIFKFFPSNQILIMKYEDMKHDNESALRKVSSFLNIDPFLSCEFSSVHLTKYHKKFMTHHDRVLLRTVFCKEIQKIEKMLHWDCSDWV